MGKKSRHAIDPAFQHFPVIPFPFGRISTGLINALLKLDTRVQQRQTLAGAERHTVHAPDGHAFAVWEFRPDAAAPDDTLPAIVYYHGGGFVLTYASTHVAAMAEYANRVHCAVFLVDYRLAPAHPFPRGFNDCYAALTWLADRADALHVDPRRIAVMGDSAGGGYAAAVAQRAVDEHGPALAGQVLIYPVIERHGKTRSSVEMTDTPLWKAASNEKMWRVYLRDVDAAAPPPYAVPGERENLAGLPPAYIDNAEFDPLRDEGADYARRLEAAGVRVVLHEPKGTMHGYDTVLDSPITQDTLEQRVAFLRDVLGTGG